MLRKLLRAVVLLVAVATSVVAAPRAALADPALNPHNCVYNFITYTYPEGGYGYCEGQKGWFKLRLTCVSWLTGVTNTRTSANIPAGSVGHISCLNSTPSALILSLSIINA